MMIEQLQFVSLDKLELLAQHSSLKEDSYYLNSLLKNDENKSNQTAEDDAILV